MAAEAWWDGLREGVVLIDEGRVTRINRAAAALLRTDPLRAVGLPAIAVLRDHRLERVAVDGGRIEVTVRARRIEAEAIPGGLALRDVSETRRAQEGARELLAVLSHELRTPVTTIRSTLDALGYDDLEPELRSRLLARARAEAERLVRLLDDLTVDVAPPRERSVALSPLVERARGLLADRFAEHGVRLTVEVPELAVWADPDKVLQVFLNLLENAAVHGPDDAVVELSARVQSDGVAIRVPTPNVSCVDLTAELDRDVTVDEINAAMKAASEGPLKGILGITDRKLVSMDFNHDPHSSTFATDQTKVMDGNFVRILSWYDNEWGFSNRMLDTAAEIGKHI